MMLTIFETELFTRQWRNYWTEEERADFASWLSENPTGGDVVPHSGGVRKVRWGKGEQGKRGGVRIIYFNRLEEGEIWLLVIYGKNVRENIPAHILRALKEAIDHAHDGRRA